MTNNYSKVQGCLFWCSKRLHGYITPVTTVTVSLLLPFTHVCVCIFSCAYNTPSLCMPEKGDLFSCSQIIVPSSRKPKTLLPLLCPATPACLSAHARGASLLIGRSQKGPEHGGLPLSWWPVVYSLINWLTAIILYNIPLIWFYKILYYI